MMKSNGRAVRKTIAAAFTMGTIGLFGAGTALADHTHSMQTGKNGSCVLLAQNGGEKYVTLPYGDGGVKSHPLHLNVHRGEPGAGGHIAIGVAGTSGDPCFADGAPIDYLND